MAECNIQDIEQNNKNDQFFVKLREQAHVLEGLLMVLSDKKIAETIRKHFDFHSARTHLVARFRLDKIQAEYVLNMPFEVFHDLVADDIEKQYNDLMGRIAELEEKQSC